MKNGFSEFIVVISGAGSGIGLAAAKKFSNQGARVFGLDIYPGDLENIDFCTWVKCDIGSDESVTNAFNIIKNQVSRIDILVNNAGVGSQGAIETATTEEWNRVLNINVIGTSRVSAAALSLLRQSLNAAIVNTCSVVATTGIPNRVIYSASKGAVLSLTLAMAADLIQEKIRVNGVNPGTAETPWVERLLSQSSDPIKERAALESRQPMGRLVSADEVANAIIYLAHPEQGSTTGTILAVDGGLHSLNLPKHQNA